MYKIIPFILILVSINTCFGTNDIINKTELVFGFMTHRHGDRSPLSYAIQFMTDPSTVLELTNKHGFGQLTDRGRRRGYEVGQFIRRRYGSLLSRHYNKSEIYIRSTDSTRAKMTVLASMAAVYPPDTENWSNDIKWTPVPYTTKQIRDDDMLAEINCPVIVGEFDTRGEKISPELLTKYDGLFNELSEILNVSITKDSRTLLRIYDAFNCQTNLEIPVHSKIEKLLPVIRKAGNDTMEYLFGGDSQYLTLQAGVLLKEFFTEVDKIISGQNVPRVRIYSGHDKNVFLLAAISLVKPSLGTVSYGALLSLELRKVIETGEYIVVPVYLSDTEGTVQYLHIDGCGDSCNLHKFRELTSKHLLDVKQWRTLCQYRDDYEIDSSEVD